MAESARYLRARLAASQKQCYAIMQDVQVAGGALLEPGPLHAGIEWLHRREWMERPPSESRRRPYQLTPSGRAVSIR
ncbi:MAG: hypothetical protein HKL89_10010 [Candidatus Dormibacteraeota bacterium]|nr:hypothetical protein [Candidatus Dormibacteraeota bacterium]